MIVKQEDRTSQKDVDIKESKETKNKSTKNK
jgi:hypothetical protein